MSANDSLLRLALRIDAIVSAFAGVVLVAFAAGGDSLLGVAGALIWALGIGFVVYGAGLLYYLATHAVIWRPIPMTIATVNLLAITTALAPWVMELTALGAAAAYVTAAYTVCIGAFQAYALVKE